MLAQVTRQTLDIVFVSVMLNQQVHIKLWMISTVNVCSSNGVIYRTGEQSIPVSYNSLFISGAFDEYLPLGACVGDSPVGIIKLRSSY